MGRTTDSGVCFLLLTYMEDRERIEILANLLSSGLTDVCWAIHDQDEAKDHCHILVRVPYSMTISAFCKRYGSRDRLVQLCGKDQEHKNYKAAAVYLLHRDKTSRAEGKVIYTDDCLYGPWKDHIAKIALEREFKQWSDDDIKIIVDHIEGLKDVCSTADLVRWACSVGIYTIFRRNISIVRDCLRERNNLLRDTDLREYAEHEIRELRERVEKSEREIAYLNGRRSRKRDLEETTRRQYVGVNVDLIRQYMFGDSDND